MAKPTVNTKWSLTGTKTEPSSGQKDAGWVVGQKPPAQWLNFWMDAVDQWKVWLAAFESTAHTWSAQQTFATSIVADGSDGSASNATIEATGTAKHGLQGNSGTTAGNVGVKGVGANRTGVGNDGVNGVGGTGTTIGGEGTVGTGGTASASTGIGGAGGLAIGGAANGSTGSGGPGYAGTGATVNGATNTAGAAGAGAVFTGGDISADANARKGGDGVTATGGSGQSGRGPAFHAVHGDTKIDDGVVNQVGGSGSNYFNSKMEVLDDVTFDAALAVGGVLTASGGIAFPARTTVFGGVGFVNSWADATGIGSERVSFRKDAFGCIHMEGAMVGGASAAKAFTLPVGSRPAKQQRFIVSDYGTANLKYIDIATNGDVTPSFASAGNNAPVFDGIVFATT